MRNADQNIKRENQAIEQVKSFLTENLDKVKFGEPRKRAFTLATPFKYVHSNGQRRSGAVFIEVGSQYDSGLVLKITMNTTTSLSDSTVVQRTLRKAFKANQEVTFNSKNVTRLKKVQTFVESEFEEVEQERECQKARKEEKDNLTAQLVERGFDFEHGSSYSSGKGHTQLTKIHRNHIEMHITTTDVELAAKIKALLDAQGK